MLSNGGIPFEVEITTAKFVLFDSGIMHHLLRDSTFPHEN